MNNQNEITNRLFALQDTAYRDFSSALMPDVPKEKVIGVRIPALRSLAKELRGSKAAADFLKKLPHRYYEENNLHAFLLEYEAEPALTEKMEAFLPFVDNWATCDSFSPKAFQKQPPSLAHIDRWLVDTHPFTVRFGMLCLMRYYLDERFSMACAQRVAAIKSEAYYVRMMQAWYFATALAKQWDAVLPFLTEQKLVGFVYDKTIQKAVESRRITPAQKAYLKTLKNR